MGSLFCSDFKKELEISCPVTSCRRLPLSGRTSDFGPLCLSLGASEPAGPSSRHIEMSVKKNNGSSTSSATASTFY